MGRNIAQVLLLLVTSSVFISCVVCEEEVSGTFCANEDTDINLQCEAEFLKAVERTDCASKCKTEKGKLYSEMTRCHAILQFGEDCGERPTTGFAGKVVCKE